MLASHRSAFTDCWVVSLVISGHALGITLFCILLARGTYYPSNQTTIVTPRSADADRDSSRATIGIGSWLEGSPPWPLPTCDEYEEVFVWDLETEECSPTTDGDMGGRVRECGLGNGPRDTWNLSRDM